MTGRKTSPKTETEPGHSLNQSGINGQVSRTCIPALTFVCSGPDSVLPPFLLVNGSNGQQTENRKKHILSIELRQREGGSSRLHVRGFKDIFSKQFTPLMTAQTRRLSTTQGGVCTDCVANYQPEWGRY